MSLRASCQDGFGHGRSGSSVTGSTWRWNSSKTQSMMRMMRCGGFANLRTAPHTHNTCTRLYICIIRTGSSICIIIRAPVSGNCFLPWCPVQCLLHFWTNKLIDWLFNALCLMQNIQCNSTAQDPQRKGWQTERKTKFNIKKFYSHFRDFLVYGCEGIYRSIWRLSSKLYVSDAFSECQTTGSK